MYDVITIGAATQDVFLESEGFHLVPSQALQCTLECFPLGQKISVQSIGWGTGGGATNAAATFVNLGLRTGVVAKIGDDQIGRLVLSDLRQRKISTRFIQVVRGGISAFSSVLLTPHGDRTALVHRGVAGTLAARDFPWASMGARWWFVTSVGGSLDLLARIFRTAQRRGIPVAFNPGDLELEYGLDALQNSCGGARVLFLNKDEAAKLAGNADSLETLALKLSRFFPHRIVITDGKRGAFYRDHDHAYHAFPFPVNVVNTTGAGDAFGSGFISGILRWRDPVRALQLATLNAAGTIQQMGAKKGLLTKWPTKKEFSRIKVVKFKA